MENKNRNLLSRNSVVVVFDLELNQPSQKIIEVGFVIGDLRSGEILEERSIVVDPDEALAEEIVDLTGITQPEADSGKTLSEAYALFATSVRERGAVPILIQWGAHDALALFQQLPRDQKWIFGRRWIDLKSLVQIESVANEWKVVGGLKSMARRKGVIVDSSKTHRADYDARVTFELAVRYGDLFRRSEFERKKNHPKRSKALQRQRKGESITADGFTHIDVSEGHLGGRPGIVGRRITLAQILQLLSEGESVEQICRMFDLKPYQIHECLAYASRVLNRKDLLPLGQCVHDRKQLTRAKGRKHPMYFQCQDCGIPTDGSDGRLVHSPDDYPEFDENLLTKVRKLTGEKF